MTFTVFYILGDLSILASFILFPLSCFVKCLCYLLRTLKLQLAFCEKNLFYLKELQGEDETEGEIFPSAGILPRMLQTAWAQQDEASSQELCLVAHDRAGV